MLLPQRNRYGGPHPFLPVQSIGCPMESQPEVLSLDSTDHIQLYY